MHAIKKSTLLLLIALLVVAGFGPSVTFVEAADAAKTITILHTNDTHGRVNEGKYDGMGFAKLATLAQQKIAENPNVLLLDAGDTFHGTPFATLEKGDSIVKIYNQLGYDAMAAGNHDFNYGYERLVELTDVTNFPVLSANVRFEDSNELLLEPYSIYEIDGVSIGVFGLSTPETTYKTNPKNVEGLKFTDPVEEAKAMVAELEAANVDVIVALTHLGTDASSTDTSIKVANGAPGIDVIVDGHSHTVDNLSENGDSTLIVSAGEYTKNLGIVTLEFDASNNLISKAAERITKEDAANVAEDVDMKALIDGINAEQDVIKSEVVGESAVVLEGERADVRTSETNLGNLITNAMLEESKADLAITNGGGIRSSIDIGTVTLGEIINVSPFGNYLVTKKMTGATVKAALEHGVSDYPNTKGAFPHVAGMTFTLDSKANPGSRVKDLMIQGEPVDLEKEYVVATNDFLAAGGDDYTMFKDAVLINEYQALEEIMKSYIKAHSPINLQNEDRINVFVPFADVTTDHWAYDYIERLYGHGIINGVNDDTFAGSQELTRYQFAAMLVRGLNLEATEVAPFTDLEKVTEEMKAEISAAYENGLVQGFSDNTFKPNQAVTRSQMALMIKRAFDMSDAEAIADEKEMNFTDIDKLAEETYAAIEFVHELDIMKGYDTVFKPHDDATRYQVAKVVDLYLHDVK